MRHFACRLLIMLLGAVLLPAQTAQFPTSVADDADLLVARNNAQSTLSGGINDSVTTFSVDAASSFASNMVVVIGSEQIFCTTFSSTTFSGCTRGFDTSSAASHSTGATVSGYLVAWHHNALKEEVKAVETALGASLGNVQASDADLTAVAALTSTGLVARTGAATYSERTLTGTANEVTVTNGDGVSGNPTLSLPTGIDAAKVGGGGVSTAEYDRLGTVSSNVQDQIDAKQSLANEQSGAPVYCAPSGATDTYTCTLTPTLASYTTGMTVVLNPDVNNTGAATLNIDTLGAKAIKILSSGAQADPSDNDIDADGMYLLAYDGTVFIAYDLEPAGAGDAPGNAKYVVIDYDGTLSDERKVAAGNGITLTDNGAGLTLEVAVDGTYVATQGGNNTLTGDNNFGGGGLEVPNSISLPGTCTVGEIYIDSNTSFGQAVYWCSATNTWTPIGVPYCAPSGGTDTYTCTTGLGAYYTGLVVLLNPNVNNTGACTVNLDSLGAKAVKVLSSGAQADPSNNNIDADGMYLLKYDGTVFLAESMEGGSGGGLDLTTKGDLHGYDTGQARVPVGTNGMVLRANSGDAQGVDYAYIKEERTYRVGTISAGSTVYPSEIMYATASGVTLQGNGGGFPHSLWPTARLDDGNDEGGDIDIVLPSTYVGTPSLDIHWTINSTTTNSVVWQVNYACTAEGEDGTPPSLASAGSSVTDAHNGTAWDLNIATYPLTLTTCSAGEWLRLYIFRDGDNVSDNLTETIDWMWVKFEYLRTLQ